MRAEIKYVTDLDYYGDPIRVFAEDANVDEPYFALVDIHKATWIDIVRKLSLNEEVRSVRTEKGKGSGAGTPNLNVAPFHVVNDALIRTRAAEAQEFRRWLCNTALESLGVDRTSMSRIRLLREATAALEQIETSHIHETSKLVMRQHIHEVLIAGKRKHGELLLLPGGTAE